MIDDDLIDDASAVGRLLGTLRSMADEFFACSVGRRPFTLRSMGDEFSSPTMVGDEKNDFVSRFSLKLFSFYVFIL